MFVGLLVAQYRICRAEGSMAVRQGLQGLVQYIALRSDLLRVEKWPVGAVVAQACHASTAVLHLYSDDPNVVAYLGDVDRMHKVVLEVGSESDLRLLASVLEKDGVHFKLWVEQPEDTPTCLATKPYPKTEIQKYFKKFKLFK